MQAELSTDNGGSGQHPVTMFRPPVGTLPDRLPNPQGYLCALNHTVGRFARFSLLGQKPDYFS